MSKIVLARPTEVGGATWPLIHMTLDVRADDTADQRVFRLSGELDMATSPRLERVLSGVLAAMPPALAIDLAGLTFLDSTGIRVLIDAGRRASGQGCAFTLLSPRPNVLRMLRLTGAGWMTTVVTDPARV